MKSTKIIIILLFITQLTTTLQAQTQGDQQRAFTNAKRDMYAQFTQYSQILPLLNPAYNGATGELNMFFITREQWGGNIEGAPISGAYNINGLISSDAGIGWGTSLLYEQFGAQKYFDINLSSNYILKLGNNRNLAMGLQLSLNMYFFDKSEFGGEQIPFEIIQSGYMIPNIGFGFFYYTDKLYAGISAPELMAYNEETGANDFANIIFDPMQSVYFSYFGYGDRLSNDFDYKGNFLNKFSFSDITAELSGIFTYKKKIGLGVGYRLNASVIGIVEFEIFRGFDFGYSYDFPIHETHIQFGSHELRFNYSFEYDKVEIESSIRYW